ncbi:hypothetical protein [Knoellia koreensis]|uniref:Uncharacterized protein n=1 Tax=Knoellia koreensis TaxID=2730921 RepID=A0A849HBU9_9MICO|nr:hypothetical protein [Knoellia sp. DB2414S]NNM44529.1 hypothetical protein [Knoellia sp. DB2414S]
MRFQGTSSRPSPRRTSARRGSPSREACKRVYTARHGLEEERRGLEDARSRPVSGSRASGTTEALLGLQRRGEGLDEGQED